MKSFINKKKEIYLNPIYKLLTNYLQYIEFLTNIQKNLNYFKDKV